MSKETFHVISNTHWDREWYQCHEKYLVRLVELIDRLLDIMEAQPDYRFITDGQFAMVGDYLEAKPENRDRIKKLVAAGRLLVGPWYTQPLENIVGGEALIRNLQSGISESEKLGKAMRFSYEIDEFGHTSQLPQILSGFGINGIMAWRGVPYNCKSLFRWEGVDGTVSDFFNSNAGYGEATSLPDSEEDFSEIIDGIAHKRDGLINHVKKIRDLRFHVSDSSHMLWLNGIDHSWAQEDILEICEKIENLFPDYKVIQSTPEEYSKAVIEDLKLKGINPPHAKGELMFTAEPVLESTNALHPRQKRRHYESEKMLVRKTEPLTAVSSMLGAKYPQWALTRAWKYVLENHAHDSLGCCSVDEVFEQVMARYGAAISLCEQENENALRYIMSCGEKSPSLWIFNISEKPVEGAVKAEFDIPVGFGGENIELVSPDGSKVNMSIISVQTNGDVRYNPRLGHPTWGEAAHFNAIIDTPPVPAFGAVRLDIVKQSKEEPRNRQNYYFVSSPDTIENKHLRVEINSNGTFTLTDKRSGNVFRNQLLFTDDGEAGNCYVHIEPLNDAKRITSFGCNADISTLYDTPLGAAVEISISMDIPAGITDDRKRRLSAAEKLKIRSVLSLNENSEYLSINIHVDNQSKNHRLRVLFPSGLVNAQTSESGQAFDEVERPVSVPEITGLPEAPYMTHPMQDYCAVSDGGCGLGVSARGIYEYECTDDGSRSLALTLLRSIEVIDNDTFEKTPAYFMNESQNLCCIDYSLNLIPYDSCRETLLPLVKASLSQPVVIANRETEDSVMPGYKRPENIIGDRFSLIEIAGEGIELTAFKKAFDGSGYIVRIFNRTNSTVSGNFRITLPGFNVTAVYKTNLEEKEIEKCSDSEKVTFELPAKRIASFRII